MKMLRSELAAFCLTLAIHTSTAGSSVAPNPVDVHHTFLDDADLRTNSSRPVPINLGFYPYECLGNLNLCLQGFTFSLWYRPDIGNNLMPYRYIMSSGGQSVLSEGMFFRQIYGEYFEIGVSLGNRIWTTSIYLLTNLWTNVAFSWNEQDGLFVYIDGKLMSLDGAGSVRVASVAQFDPFPDVVIGRSNDAENLAVIDDKLAVWRVEHINRVYNSTEMTSFVGNVSNFLILSCGTAAPWFDLKAVGVVSLSDPASFEDVSICRDRCLANQLNLVVFRQSVMCRCLDYQTYNVWLLSNPGWASATCTQDNLYTIQWASHADFKPLFSPINMQISLSYPTTNGYVQPGETVTFSLSESTIMPVTFSIDFDDGTVAVTTDSVIGHSWAVVGVYFVNVTAATRTTVQSKILQVNITYVDNNTAPEQLIVKIDPVAISSDTPEAINLFVSAYSPLAKTCTISYDDLTTSSFPNISDFVFSSDVFHQYQTMGFYDVILSCSNDIGTSSAAQIALAVNPNILYTNQDNTKDISIPVVSGSNVSISNVIVLVNNVQQIDGVVQSAGVITITKAGLAQDGEHVIAFQTSSGTTLSMEVFNIQAGIENVVLVASTSARAGQPVNISLTIAKGDGLNINISYGDSFSEIITVVNSSDSTMIVRNHSYSTLGVYILIVTVANDVSFYTTQQIISIESKLQTATMSGTNVSTLNNPTVFSFNIDSGLAPGMPIYVDFDYDDGTQATVLLQQLTNSSNSQFISTYVFQKYGIYRVRATIKNKISAIVLPTVLVQVGENITLVDIYVNQSLVTLGQDVVLTVVCPTGTPVVLSVDMGDGQPFFVTRPVTYMTLDDKTYVRPNTSDQNSTAAKRSRRESASYQYTFTSTLDFVITYRYKTTGMFSVSMNASNIFSSAASSLCPNIIVVSSTSVVPQCSNVVAVLTNANTLSRPLVRQRSTLISIPASATPLQCSPATSAFYTAGYTWTVDRLVAANTWRPELQVCASNIFSTSLVISPNTLWYGTYRLNVTVIVNTASSSSLTSKAQPTIIKSTPVTTYLSIVPSPLVATIANSDQVNYVMSQVINVDLSQSGDPDVVLSNKTGVNMYLFCYTNAQRLKFAGLTLNQMLNQSTFVTQNIDKNVAVYMFKNAPCFLEMTNIWVSAYKVVIAGSSVTMDDTVDFLLFVTKDSRVNSTVMGIHVWPTNNSASALDGIDALLASGNTDAALLVINMVTGSLNTDTEGEEAKQGRTELRGLIINALGKVSDKIHNVDQLSKTADVINTVTNATDEVTVDSKANASSALGNTASRAKTLAENFTQETMTSFTLSMLNGIGNILPFDPPVPTNITDMNSTTPSHSRRRRSSDPIGSPSVNASMRTCCENASGVCDWIEPVGYRGVSEFDRKKLNWTEADCLLYCPYDVNTVLIRYNVYLQDLRDAANAVKAKTAQNGMGAVSDMGGILISKQSDGAEPQALQTPKMNLTVTKLGSNEGAASSDYILPSIPGGCGAVSLVAPNPYTYGASSSLISGNVKTLSMTACDGTPVKVDNSSEPITLWMDGSSATEIFQNFTFSSTPKGSSFNYHRIDIDVNDSAIFVTIIPSGPNDAYSVYMLYQTNNTDKYPNATFYNWVGVVPVPNVVDQAKKYTIFLPLNLTAINGTYRIGIRLKEALVKAEDLNSASNFTYEMSMFTAACRYWNDTMSDWDTSGCQVGNRTNFSSTECLCTHLTSFGGSFAVPPNTIDFNTVFTAANFLQSIPVFSTVVALIVLYVLILIWARHMDKKDIVRWGAMPLEDNLPTDHYHYQLSVYTAVRKNAGTASKPSFILSGDEADTGVRRLSDGKRKTIPAGSIYNYVLSVENTLGPLTFLRIWHDNSAPGKRKGWYLDQIHITDLQTGDRFFFICDRWMAVEEDDGQVERIIPVAGTGDLTQFKNLFTHSLRKKFTNDHMWLSVFSRPTRSSFTRMQRISCCFALLFLTMITNCMFFKASDPNHETSIHIGPIELTAQQIYISVVSTCIVLPPSVAIVTIFRRALPKKNAIEQQNQSKKFRWRTINPGSALWDNDEQPSRARKFKDAMSNIVSFHQRNKYKEDGENANGSGAAEKKKKKQPIMFPWWTNYIAWALVFLSIGLSGFFTILYSMQWGKQKSVDWLTTFILSFFQSVIVVQPIKVLALAAFLSCILRKPDIEEEESPMDDNQLKPDEEFISHSERDIQEIRRMREMAHAETTRPDTESLKIARAARLKELDMERIIKDCLIYLAFILVLYFISYQDKDKRSFLFSQGIQNQFLQGNPNFDNIENTDDVYNWVNQTLIPNLYSNGWYNGQQPTTWKEALQVGDMVTVRLGVARLRQLRIKDNTCTVLKSFRGIIKHCRSDYNWMDDDTSSYTQGWADKLSKKNASSELKADIAQANSWIYRDSVDLKSGPYMGIINTYKGGGYVYNFFCSPEKTVNQLDELKNLNWLDVHTRAVIIEFTLYNANVNLYGSVIMLVEFLANGAPVVSQEVKVFRLTSYLGPFGAIVILFQLIFVAFIVYFFVHMVNLLRKEKLAYFKSFWNILDFLTLVMSIVTVGMYAMKIIFGNMAMDILKKTGSGQYVNFVTIGQWDTTYGIILAVVVFLSTIKFLNMLKFNRRLSMLTATVSRATADLKSFIITFFLYFFAFTMLGYLLLGTQMQGYNGFVNSIETLFRCILGDFDYPSLVAASPILGPIFFFIFTWVVVFGMQTMFLVIIIEAFQAVRSETKFARNEYEIGDFILGKFKGLFGMK